MNFSTPANAPAVRRCEGTCADDSRSSQARGWRPEACGCVRGRVGGVRGRMGGVRGRMVSSCNSPWAVTPARMPYSKG